MLDEILDGDGLAQAQHVARGDVSSAELVEASIRRIEKRNPALNAVIHPLFDKAMAQVAAGEIGDGAFRGVPFLVKDALCHTAGDPYHCGMRALKEHGYKAETDTELARRFRAAGFVFVGKTNTPELAMSATTEPLAYGATCNPWSVEHSPGGSSGGSAAAVASRMVAAGHANDMGGSIRIPASFCGLVGLKPTRGRATLAPDFGEYWGPLTHEHVVCRSVRDSAAILDAISGPAPGDPYSAPAPREPFLRAIERAPGPLRVGLVHRTSGQETDPECLRALHLAAGWLEQLGHAIEPISLPSLDDVRLGPWIAAGLARDLDRWSEVIGRTLGPDDVEPFNWAMAEAGRALDGAAFVEHAEAAHAWARRFCNEWLEHADVLLLPTSPVPPPRLGELAPTTPMPELAKGLGCITTYTGAFDVTGQPAISLPLHWTEDGLPIGVQLAAHTGREDLLLQLARSLEQAQPWANRQPAS